MIKNMKIRKSLILGYAVTIVVSAIIIVVSLLLMNMQKNEYTMILNRYVKSNQLTNQCRINYNVVGRRLRDAVLSGDMNSIQTAEDKMDELSSLISELESTYPLENKTELNNFVSVVKNWETTASEIATVTRTDRTAASQMIIEDCTPALDQAATAGQALSAVLAQEQENIINRQQVTTNIAMVVIVAVLVIATIVVLRMALIIIKSIVVPVEEVRRALNGFSEGKLDIAVNYESQNELGFQSARISALKGESELYMRARACKVLGLVGMRGVESRYPAQLSIGECRRVELARALIGSPPILVLDEITANLDDDNIWDIMHLLNDINRRGTTVIMATHASQYVNIMCRRVVTLVDGHVFGDVKKGRYGDVIEEKRAPVFYLPNRFHIENNSQT